MKLSDYNFFYVNGCSFTEGGGLEEPEISKKSIIKYYTDLHGIGWKNRVEVNWANRLSQIIGIDCINEAKSGAGVERVVRTTYNFIEKNWEKRNEFFIILQLPAPKRLELYVNGVNDYYIVNVKIDIKKNICIGGGSRDYFKKDYLETDESKKDLFYHYVKNHFSFNEKVMSDDRLIVGLYSFCKLNNIKIYLDRKPYFLFLDTISNDDILFNSPCTFCVENKMRISDELNTRDKFITNDAHPGYFGHIEYAKRLATFLGWVGEMDIFPIKNKRKQKIL